VRADKIDPGSGLRLLFRDVADVDGQEIHGDSADYGRAAVADIGAAAIGEGAHETVRISDPHRRQPRLPGETVGRTITNSATSVNAADLQDFRLQPDHLPQRVGLIDERRDAVESSTRTDEIKGVVRAEEDAGGGGKAAQRIRRQR
jgi:hypothetical protein